MNRNVVILVGVAVLAGLAYTFMGSQDKDGMKTAEGPKIGIILGYTGPIESLTPDMALGAELAISEANESGNFALGAATSVRADSTCIDSAAATAAAERLVTFCCCCGCS